MVAAQGRPGNKHDRAGLGNESTRGGQVHVNLQDQEHLNSSHGW